MNITQTGSNLLVQTKQETNSVKSTTPLVAAQDTDVVQPALPTESIMEVSQDSKTETTILPLPAESTPAEEADAQTINSAVSTLNEMMSSMSRDLEFEFDQELGKTIVIVRDTSTQEVVRKLPSDAAIKLAKVLQDTQSQQEGPIGQLLDVKT